MTHPTADSDGLRWQQSMTRSLLGDSVEYHALLDELYGVVGAYLRRMLGDSPFLEDCVQECLETLHRNRHTYDVRRPFRPWFLTLVRHKAIDFMRRDRSRTTSPLDESPATKAHPTPTPEHGLDAATLLSQLDPMYREAIVLTKLNGYTTAEAAALVGVTGTALRTRVHRGLRELSHLLEQEAAL
ncbi:MAG: RNA polymerase sigma factor [Myxococcota bacterium]